MKKILAQQTLKGSQTESIAVVYRSIHEANKKVISVPKWSIFIAILFLFFLYIVMIAAFVILIGAPRPGLYLESCNQRSCSKENKLKCIDSVCQCLPTEYYTNKCITKKSFLQKCQAHNQCSTAYCNLGQCDCVNKTSECKGYNQYCKINSDCIQSKLLTCISSKCGCDNSRFWDGEVCVKKRLLNERCSTFEFCDSSANLVCSSNTCQCIYNTHIENITTMKCGWFL